MTAKQTRRWLIIAFAISLLIHSLVALRLQSLFVRPKDDVQIVRIEHVHTLRVTRLPTPPPHTPPPLTPSPAPSSAPSATPQTKAQKPIGTRGAVSSSVGAPPRVTPAPPTPSVAASPTPNCAKTDTPVTLVSKPEAPDIATAARSSGTNGITRVRVTVDEHGVVNAATVTDSSGNTSLDVVAISVARGAHYAPATHACKAIASEYTFSVKWTSW